jgi:hypothetical protein
MLIPHCNLSSCFPPHPLLLIFLLRPVFGPWSLPCREFQLLRGKDISGVPLQLLQHRYFLNKGRLFSCRIYLQACQQRTRHFPDNYNAKASILNIVECTVAHSKHAQHPRSRYRLLPAATYVLRYRPVSPVRYLLLKFWGSSLFLVCVHVVMRKTNYTHFETRGFSQDLTEQSRILGCDAVYSDVSVKIWRNPHHPLLVGHSVLPFTDRTNRTTCPSRAP